MHETSGPPGASLLQKGKTWCAARGKNPLEAWNYSLKGMILNLGAQSLKKINHRKVCKRDRWHPLTQTQRDVLDRGDSASSFSLGPAGMALSDIWTALMKIWASHGVLNVRMSYLKLHLELKTERLIFWWSPWGCFSTKLNEKEINLEEINLRRNLCLFFPPVCYTFSFIFSGPFANNNPTLCIAALSCLPQLHQWRWDAAAPCKHLTPLVPQPWYWKCLWMYPLPHSSHNANHQLGEEIKSGGKKKRNKNNRPGNIHIKHSIVLAPKLYSWEFTQHFITCCI